MNEFHVPWKVADSKEAREAVAQSIVKHKSRITFDSEGARIIPVPTSEQQNDPLFQAIWQTIKNWDIRKVDGNPALLILEAVKKTLAGQEK